MQWWALIPVASTITGPAALYLLSRRKQGLSDTRGRYDELSRRYTTLLEETASGELPDGRGHHPEVP